MGCFHSIRPGPRGSTERESYVETLTLKRQVTKKINGQNVKISISVISDPYSSLEDIARESDCRYGEQYFELDSGFKRTKRRSHRTLSYAEGRRFTKFPNHVGYKLCLDCQQHKQDVRKTLVHSGDKELCRSCSVKNRNSRKSSEASLQTGLDIASFAHLLALVSKLCMKQFCYHIMRDFSLTLVLLNLDMPHLANSVELDLLASLKKPIDLDLNCLSFSM